MRRRTAGHAGDFAWPKQAWDGEAGRIQHAASGRPGAAGGSVLVDPPAGKQAGALDVRVPSHRSQKTGLSEGIISPAQWIRSDAAYDDVIDQRDLHCLRRLAQEMRDLNIR